MSRLGWENADTCSRHRERATQLAARSWPEALKVASQITLPWYRVQALASLVIMAPEEHVDAVLKKARDAAALDSDAYRRIAVLAWVIAAAIERGRVEFARQVLADALTRAPTITPPKSRAYALELLLGKAGAIGEREARSIAENLLDVAETLSTHPYKKWRKWGKSFVNRTAWWLSRQHPSLAPHVLTNRLGTAKAAQVLKRHSPRQTK